MVVTSVGLTPANKEEIARALHPFVLADSDILGAEDLEGLLSRHPSVERANFKLWLTSTAVLERVLHNAEHCQTEFEVDRIRRKLPLFVQNDAFPRATRLLGNYTLTAEIRYNVRAMSTLCSQVRAMAQGGRLEKEAHPPNPCHSACPGWYRLSPC